MNSQVLIVDDAPMDRTRAGTLVEKHLGIKPLVAANGMEALELLKTANPQLVLADLLMPVMDGLELMTKLKKERPELPVVIVTAHGSEELAVKALQQGAANYVTKRNLARDLGPVLDSVLTSIEASRHRRHMLACLTHVEMGFKLKSDPALVAPLVDHLLETLTDVDFGTSIARIRTRVAVEEAIINALHHGNLEVSSDLKQQDDRAYKALVEERSRQAPYRDRAVHVHAHVRPTDALFVIRDEGSGFDPNALPDPTDPANLERCCGRGLLLIRTFMDEVRYNAAGNEITIVKRCPQAMPS